MAETSTIEWTDATWNPVTGCSVVSPGCAHCYAMRLAGGRLRNHPSRAGLTAGSRAGPVWTGAVRLNEGWLDQPLRWKRPRRIFVCAHGDLFHESVPAEWIDRVFAVMALSPRHVFQVLTKRPARMRGYLRDRGTEERTAVATAAFAACADGYEIEQLAGWEVWPPRNVWLGVSVEDQRRADERIPALLATPAALRWISAEPLLGPVDVAPFLPSSSPGSTRGRRKGSDPRLGPRVEPGDDEREATLHWVVAGGESGPGARPMHPDWARALRDACASAGTPFFFKQWGAWAPVRPGDDTLARVGKGAAGATLDGREWREMPR